MDVGSQVKWFEEVCARLSSDPAYATKALLEFRESEHAFPLSASMVSMLPQLSPTAQFQAVSILQYCFVKSWNRIDDSYRREIQRALLEALKWCADSPTVVTFTTRKIIQALVITWKHAWISSSSTPDMATSERSILFETIRVFLEAGPQAMRIGFAYIKECAEEFAGITRERMEAHSSTVGSSGILSGLQLSTHIEARLLFENDGLEQVFTECLVGFSSLMQKIRSAGNVTGPLDDCLRVQFSIISIVHSTGVSSWMPPLAEACQCLVELLNWNFDQRASIAQTGFVNFKANDKSNESTSSGRQSLQIPNRWGTLLMQSNSASSPGNSIIVSAIDSYNMILSNLQLGFGWSGATALSGAQLFVDSLTQLRLLMIAFSSLSGSTFSSMQDKAEVGAFLLRTTSDRINQASILLKGAESQIMCDVATQELVSFSLQTLQLFDNFTLAVLCQLPEFESSLMALGNSIVFVADIVSANASRNDDSQLLESWSGEVLNNFLSAMGILVNDPIIVRRTGTNHDSEIIRIQELVLVGMRPLTGAIFSRTVECVINVALSEILRGSAEEEEEEDIEELAQVEVFDLLALTCGMGRVCPSAVLDCCINRINECTRQCNHQMVRNPDFESTATGRGECTANLEVLRVVTLVASFFCFENYSIDSSMEGMASKSSESPSIPALLMDCISQEASSNVGAPTSLVAAQLNQLFRAVVNMLQYQFAVLQQKPSSMQLSPILLQLGLVFAAEYSLRYVAPDPTLYDTTQITAVILLRHTHDTMENASQFHALLTLSQHCLVALPLEQKLVFSVAHLINSMARMSQALDNSEGVLQARKAMISANSLIQHPSISAMAELLAGQPIPSIPGLTLSRLSVESLGAMYEAIAEILSCAGNPASFSLICQGLYTKMVTIDQISGKIDPLCMRAKLQCIASVRGIACCSCRGLETVLFSFLGTFLPLVAGLVQQFGGDDDVLLKESLLCTRDLAETQLPRLPLAVSSSLYSTSLACIHALAFQCAKDIGRRSTDASGEEEAFRMQMRSELISITIQMLNHLATKDLLLDDDTTGSVVTSVGERQIIIQVGDVLLVGLQLLVRQLTAELLSSFTKTSFDYFSFIALTVGAFDGHLASAVRSSESGLQFFNALLQHLCWAVGAIDGNSARLALQAIQGIAVRQRIEILKLSRSNGFQGTDQSYGNSPEIHQVFGTTLFRLLQILLVPSSCEYGIASDRVESYATTLFALIALDLARYRECVVNIVSTFSESLQPVLFRAFEALSSVGNIDFNSTARNHKMQFVKNFRAFMIDVGPQIQYL